jgi:hypothetical protein
LSEQSGKNVHIVATEHVVDGIAAMYGYMESASVEENIPSMTDCIGLADTLEVFMSSRNATFAGVKIDKGSYFVVGRNELLSVSTVLEEAVENAVDKVDTSTKSNISLYYGDTYDAAKLEGVLERLAMIAPHLECALYFGGQQESLIVAIE